MALALDSSRYPAYAAECGDPSRTKKLGFGARPAILLLDLCEAYFDASSSPIALPPDTIAGVSKAVAEVLDAARDDDDDNSESNNSKGGQCDSEVPVIYAQTLYTHPSCRDAGLASLKTGYTSLFSTHNPLNLVAIPQAYHAIHPRPNDLQLKKKYPSAFFGTNLSTQLAAMDIDTLIIGGLTTSLNVRATALDAMQAGFRAIVVAEACGDRVPELHWANLMDIAAKYGDVVGVHETVDYLRQQRQRHVG